MEKTQLNPKYEASINEYKNPTDCLLVLAYVQGHV